MNHENYDLSFPEQPVVDQYLPVWSSLPAFRSKPAFIWSDDGSTHVSKGSTSTLTYGRLNDSVQSISFRLLGSLKRGETVVILCSPGLELVEIIFGCQRAGLLSVPISPPDPSFSKQNFHHLARVLSQTKPRAAIAHHDYIRKVQQYLSLPSKDKSFAEMLQNLSWISTAEIKHKRVGSRSTAGSTFYNGCKPDEFYLIQYTSGATGIPKPVLVTAGSAAHNVRTARKAYDLHPNSVIVSWLPQYHDCGLMFLLLTIVSGATCVLTSPAAFVNRPRLWLELITEFKATCTPVPSFTLPLVVKRGGVANGSSAINLWSMRNLIIINEPIYKASVEEFIHVFKPFGLKESSISPSYGLAENCTFVSTAWRNNDETSGNSTFPSHNKLLPSARLVNEEEQEEEDMNIVVVDEVTLEPVADGIEGEIWVSSPSNASGYLGHPYLTQDTFKGRLSSKSGRCFVRTGDRGIVKGEQRFLFVTGRCLDVIKLPNGREIHPHYIETTAYNSCPRFLRGGCLAAFDASRMIVLVAEMQRSENDDKMLKNICERIREAVSNEEKAEIGMVILVSGGSVPKTTSGKIQRWRAKDDLLGGKMDVLMEMKFDNYHWGLLPSPGAVISANKGRGQRRGRDREGEEQRCPVAEEKEEILVPISSAPTHHYGLSRL